MKTETALFAVLVAFFAIVTPIYWFLSHDPTGAIALLLSFFFSLVVSSYSFITGRKLPVRPEDRLDGEIADGAGELGFFSPHSYWPLWAAATSALFVFGIAVGWWLAILAFPLLVIAVLGFLFEYYREEPESRPSSHSVS